MRFIVLGLLLGSTLALAAFDDGQPTCIDQTSCGQTQVLGDWDVIGWYTPMGDDFLMYQPNEGYNGISCSVTIHGTLNGITSVSCSTGACFVSSGFFGSTKVCDGNNVCVGVVGQVQDVGEKEEIKEEND